MRVTFIVLVLYIITGIQNTVSGAEATQLIISEIYPAPPTGEQEWVELYNPTITEISLAGYTLLDELATPSTLFIGTAEIVPPKGYLVVVISGSKLNNTGDVVHLISPENIKIDSLSFSTSSQGLSWQRTTAVGAVVAQVTPTKGTESNEYSLSETTPSASPTASPLNMPIATALPLPTVSPTPTPANTPTPTPIPTPTATPIPTASPTSTPSPIQYEQLRLSEIMPCPASGPEWIELLNTGSLEINVAGMKVQDESGNTKIISGSISAGEYATFSWTGSLLNNAGDTVDLITPTGSSIAHAEFSNCSTGKSFVFATDSAPGQWMVTQPTPGKPNIFPSQSQLTDPLITQQTTQDEVSLQNSNTTQSEVLGAQITAPHQSVKAPLPFSSLNLTTTATQSASVSAFLKETPKQKIQTVPFSMHIQRGFLLFACIGAFTGGTLLLYEKIKQTVHPLA